MTVHNSYLNYISNSLKINDLYANNRLPNETNQNNLEISFLQIKRNFERSIINNSWRNSIEPKKEFDFFILHKNSENPNEKELLKKLKFKEKTKDEIQGLNENITNVPNTQQINIILGNKIINVEQMNSDSLHMNNRNKKNNFLEEMINQNSNEIKIMKNNKAVFANNIDSFSKINKIKIKKILFKIRKRKRGSKYRGVSKNGKKWQV